MRPGQNKRMRGRPNNSNNNGTGGQRKGPNPLTRSYESNGPDVKIRGNAHHVAEKYLQLARDAQSSGDPVAAESYLQHAEHYFRLIASAQAAQAGFSRQPDAVDTEDDDDDSGIPDRFASPQPPAPFVPAPAPQPYAAERQPYNGERQPYNGERQGGERQPYVERPLNGERPAYAERNNFERPPRQDRQQDRGGQDRGSPDRNAQDRPAPDRNGLNRRPYRDNAERGGEERGQDRGFQDRGQDRNGQTRRNGQDRGFQDRVERQERAQPIPYRDHQAEQPGETSMDEQPRFDAVDRQPEPAPRPDPMPAAEPVPRFEPAPRAEVRPEPVLRAEAPPRAAPVSEEVPGLPSFITAPTRAPAAEPPAPALATAFPGDGAEDAPKFPRRRRRTTRATADAGETPAGDQSGGD